MAVTIKDVAALAGVSSSTVSRTCKNNPSISEETKEKVRRAMAQLGYEPNFQASNLASQNSRTIGIILPVSAREAYENSFYLEAIRGISQLCNKRQYINTVITGESEEEVLQVIKTMARSGQVDGFIVLYSRQDDPIADFLYNEGFLYVLVGKAYTAEQMAGCGPGLTPSSDDFLCGYVASWPDEKPWKGFLKEITNAAALKTNDISGSLLKHAGEKMFSEDILQLLKGFESCDPALIRTALKRVSSFGSSSGCDFLTGMYYGVIDSNKMGGNRCGKA